MRNFENARKLGKNLCQLNDMTDEELTEALRGVNIKFDVELNWEGFNPKPWSCTDKTIDISKAGYTSRTERGMPIK